MSEKTNVRIKEPPFKDCLRWYSHDFFCDNCGKRNPRYILRPVLAKSVNVECTNCGCNIQQATHSPFTVSPVRVNAIERNMKFVLALQNAISQLKIRAGSMSTGSEEAYGLLHAIDAIEKVMDEYVE